MTNYWEAEIPNLAENKAFLKKLLEGAKTKGQTNTAQRLVSIIRQYGGAEIEINVLNAKMQKYEKMESEFEALKRAHEVANLKYLELQDILKLQHKISCEKSKDMADFAQGQFAEAVLLFKPKHFKKINW